MLPLGWRTPFASFIATTADREALVTFFSDQFVRHEPLARALRVTPEAFRPMAEVVVGDALAARNAFVLRRGGRVVALGMVRDATVPPSQDLSRVCPAAAPIHALLDEVSAPFLARHPPRPGKTLDGMFALVDPSHGAAGLGTRLSAWVALVCALRGYVEATVCLTNPRSQRMILGLGATERGRLSARARLQAMGHDLAEDPGDIVFATIDARTAAVRGAARALARALYRGPSARRTSSTKASTSST